MQTQTVDVTRYAIGVMLLALTLIPIGSVFLPKLKGKFPDLKWLSGWVNGRMLITFAIGIIITLTVREFLRPEWNQFFSQHGWYAWLALIAGNFLFCLLFGRENKTGSGSNDSSSGGKSTLGAVAVFLLAVYVIGSLIGLVMVGMEQADRSNRGQAAAGSGVASNQLEPEGSWFPKTATTNGWTAIHVGRGIKMRCVIVHPTAHILSRYNNELPHEDWRDQELIPAPRETPYDFYIKSAGADSVPVKIYLTH